MAKTKAKAAEQKTFKPGNLSPAEGSTRKAMRVGRGRASGSGKTCNRGHNGEGQRSGRSSKRGFEGGQMPGYRRIPKKKGFRLVNPRKWLELNLSDLDRVLTADETELTYDLLKERGFMRNGMDGLRLLGNGELNRKVTIHAHHVTKGAREKVEKAGGTISIVEPLTKAE